MDPGVIFLRGAVRECRCGVAGGAGGGAVAGRGLAQRGFDRRVAELGVFERVGHGRVLFGFHHHPAAIARQGLKDGGEVHHAVTGHGVDAGDDGVEEAPKEPEMTDIDCEKCGLKMMKRWGKNGWFLGCSGYPKCKTTRNVPLGVTCPKCGGEIVEIRAKGRGRPFYGCSNYAKPEVKCDFKLWQKPVPDACPQCSAKFLVKAGGKKNPVLKCVTEGCGYERPDDAVLAEDSENEDLAQAG